MLGKHFFSQFIQKLPFIQYVVAGVGWYQHFISSIWYYKFKMVFSITWYFSKAQLYLNNVLYSYRIRKKSRSGFNFMVFVDDKDP